MSARVAIIGGGPAGAAAALYLARNGAACTLIEAGARATAGECVPPEAAPLLARAGLIDPSTEGHRASAGVRVNWTGEETTHDYLTRPHGRGWNLDRLTFDEGLRARAEAAGAHVLKARFHGLAGVSPFRLVLSAEGEVLECAADAVLDASGRVSAFARRAGAKRFQHDRLIALHARHTGVVEDPRLLIERTEAGWWYSAGLRDALVVSFQTRDNLKAPPPPPPATRRRLQELSPASVTRYAAGSSRLDAIAGEGWLAIGDAAVAHDPLSGHGIAAALRSGFDGAAAMLAWLSGNKRALRMHAEIRDAAWRAYIDGLAAYYAQPQL